MIEAEPRSRTAVSEHRPVGIADAPTRQVAPLTEGDVAAGVVPRLRDVVRAQPDALAVADDHHELTYAQLAATAARVLAGVRGALASLPAPSPEPPDGNPEPVGLLFSHEVWAVAALVGVIGSGYPVLVLDPRTPAQRLQQFVERAGVRLLVADEANEAVAGVLATQVVVPLRDGAPGDPVDAGLLWAAPPAPTSVAALAFTSGSTGTPKPVANDHLMLVRDAWNSSIATGCYGTDDVLAHTLPLAFHAGLTTTVHGLLVGAVMRLYDARARGIGPLPGWIAENRATVMISSPAIVRALVASAPDPATFATLRSVTVAGESAYGRDLEALRPLLPPSCVVRNRYGSSETGLIAEYAIAADHPPLEGVVPVGRGVGRTRLGLVDPATGEEPAAGATGLVTVTAPCVAPGYWGEPEATAAAFRDNGDGTRTYRTSDLGRLGEDGVLQLTGRADHSVKIRGYLVDPGEVDAALFSLPDVTEAVVVGAPRPGDGVMRLVAYVVPTGAPTGVHPEAAQVRAALRRLLPGHMVPETVVFLEALPRTDRGKIDRIRLPAPPAPRTARPVAGEEFTSWEELVAGVWADVLGLESVGLTDDFFELGGDSLAAESLMSRMTGELNVAADLATTSLLVEAPSLKALAARLLHGAPSRGGALVPLQPDGTRLPLFLVAGGGGLGIAFVPYARRLGADQPTFALQSPVIEGRGLPDRSVRALARGHVAALREVQPNGPYQLAGHSFGGLVAFEMAHQLTAAGQEVALLAILDSFPPDPADQPLAEPRSLVRRARAAAGLALTTMRSTPGGEAHWRYFDQSTELGRRYRGRPWPGRTLVVVAQTPEKQQRSNWAPWLTGRWDLVEVAGDHLSMTRPPWSDEVADVLAAALADVRGEARGEACGGSRPGGRTEGRAVSS
jgi:acyl-coenzyme A synthetase/AMP-(fatty) acid ligase/thioesterase domain-containing protein